MRRGVGASQSRGRAVAHREARNPGLAGRSIIWCASAAPMSTLSRNPASRVSKPLNLGAVAEKRKLLSEAKTINISEIEACRRHNQGVGTVTDRLDGFFRKLAWHLAQANKQMLAYDAARSTKKVAYVIANFDDHPHEYVDRYQVQIDQFMVSDAIPELEVVFDIKPAFYSAQS
jgi:hypothetical protein